MPVLLAALMAVKVMVATVTAQERREAVIPLPTPLVLMAPSSSAAEPLHIAW